MKFMHFSGSSSPAREPKSYERAPAGRRIPTGDSRDPSGGSTHPGVPVRTAASRAARPPNPQASAALTSPKLLKASPLASPAAIGITCRMTRKVSPAAMHTRTAFAIWIDPPVLTACWAATVTHVQHERGHQDGEDR